MELNEFWIFGLKSWHHFIESGPCNARTYGWRMGSKAPGWAAAESTEEYAARRPSKQELAGRPLISDRSPLSLSTAAPAHRRPPALISPQTEAIRHDDRRNTKPTRGAASGGAGLDRLGFVSIDWGWVGSETFQIMAHSCGPCGATTNEKLLYAIPTRRQPASIIFPHLLLRTPLSRCGVDRSDRLSIQHHAYNRHKTTQSIHDPSTHTQGRAAFGTTCKRLAAWY